MTGDGTTRSSKELPPTPARSEAQFWLTYAMIWIVVSGIFLLPASGGEEPISATFTTLAVIVGPAVLTGIPVGVYRAVLFSPDRSMGRTAVVQGLVGVGYSVGTGYLILAATQLAPSGWVPESEMEIPIVFFFVNAAFFYIIMAGVLMWTESRDRFLESQALAAREAVLRAQAEARAVRAQFNPHFVFNTLHSLMLLVRAEPATAERAIENVAGLIRYGSKLEREKRDEVTLDEEMDFARRYLALEELRLEDRLRVEWQVEEGLGGTAVPAFSLQTLLENAVKHGVAPRPDGARIQVSVTRSDGAVRLVVEDDGQGARPEAVAASDGQGLQLLQERVRVLYGDDGSLEWRTEPGGGFTATLTVPAP